MPWVGLCGCGWAFLCQCSCGLISANLQLEIGHLMDNRTVHCCSQGIPSCQELLCLSSQARGGGKMVLVAINALGVLAAPSPGECVHPPRQLCEGKGWMDRQTDGEGDSPGSRQLPSTSTPIFALLLLFPLLSAACPAPSSLACPLTLWLSHASSLLPPLCLLSVPRVPPPV